MEFNLTFDDLMEIDCFESCYFLSDKGLILNLYRLDNDIEILDIVGLLNDDIENYELYEVFYWFGINPEEMMYHSYVPDKNQKLSDAYRYKYKEKKEDEWDLSW